MRYPRGGRIVLALTLLVFGAPAADPPVARAARGSETLISFLAMTEDAFGDDMQRSFHPGNSEIRVVNSFGTVEVEIIQGDDDYRLSFAARDGKRLRERTYTETGETIDRDKQHVLEIYSDGTARCAATGRFRVRDIEYVDGQPVRLWITYRCGWSYFGYFGEVRYRIPGDGGSLVAGPRSVRWPNVDRRWKPPPTPVTVMNPGPGTTRLASARLTRKTSPAIAIKKNGCKRVALQTNDSCSVNLDLTTRKAGPKTGVLVLKEESGFVRRVPLRAFVMPGYTRFSFEGSRNDPIAEGHDRTMNFANSVIRASGDRKLLTANMDGKPVCCGAWFRTEFGALRGHRLRSGRLYVVGPDGNGYMDVSGNGVGCTDIHGYFRMHKIVMKNNRMRRFRLSFRQDCDPGAGHLTGEILWRHLPRSAR